MALMKQVVLAGLVDQSKHVLFGGVLVRDETIDLARDQGGFIAFVIDADCELFVDHLHAAFVP